MIKIKNYVRALKIILKVLKINKVKNQLLRHWIIYVIGWFAIINLLTLL